MQTYMNEDKRLSSDFIGIVKVGSKGQIVIPKPARELYEICQGDTLIFTTDKKHGMKLYKYDVISKAIDDIYDE